MTTLSKKITDISTTLKDTVRTCSLCEEFIFFTSNLHFFNLTYCQGNILSANCVSLCKTVANSQRFPFNLSGMGLWNKCKIHRPSISIVYMPAPDKTHFFTPKILAFFLFLHKNICLFVLRFYGPVNPMGSCRARSVYLTTRLLGRLSPLSG